jgi:branched-chain amino acid transport system substrate-binding protein
VSAILRLLAAIALFALACGPGHADDTVTIGAIYRLSGPAAAADARAAIETAAEILNAPHPGLKSLPLGAGRGLPRLGGAKLAVIFGDDLGNVSVAQSQALRLIRGDRVAALVGAGAAATTLAASAVAERAGVPFLVPDAEAPQITGRGFKWLFRTTPLAADFARLYAQFLTELKQGGRKLDTVAIAAANNPEGSAAAATLRDALQAAGFTVAEIGYPPNTTDLSASVAQLRDKAPAAAIVVADAPDARLFITTMNTLGYKPPVLIGDDRGFSGPGFVAASGNLAQGLIDRSAWSIGKPDSPTAIVNALYRAKSGRDIDGTAARIIQGVLVLADAIERAGSTDPAAIRDALRATDLKPGQLIVGYDGVKFDDSGQNTLGASYLVQLQGKAYATVWPAESADDKLVLP